MWRRPPLETRHEGREHALEIIAGPHRAVAVIGIVEQSGLGGPGEHHGPAAELDPIGEMGSIEHGRFERLLEAVHIDQHVSSPAGLRNEIADVGLHRFDLIEAPIAQSNRGERKSAFVGRHQPCPRDCHRGRALRPEPRLRATTLHGLACGGHEQCGVDGEGRGVVARAGRAQACASAERESAARRQKPVQERAARKSTMRAALQRISDDHAEPSGTSPTIAAPPVSLNDNPGEKAAEQLRGRLQSWPSPAAALRAVRRSSSTGVAVALNDGPKHL